MAKLTNKEFHALERNSDGDIIDLYGSSYRMTDAQIAKLTSDDASRADDYAEEMRYEMAALREEFGG